MGNKVINNDFIRNLNNMKQVDVSQMAEFTGEIFDLVNESIKNGLSSVLWKELKVINNVTESFFSSCDLYSSEEKQKIYHFASLKMLVDILENNSKQKLDEEYYIELINSYTYIRPIMKYLGEKKSSNYNEMAEVININKNDLSDFMKKLDELNLIYLYSYGEKESYYINDAGLNFYNFIIEYDIKENFEQVCTKVILNILEGIQDEIINKNLNVNNLIVELAKKDSIANHITSSYIIRSKISNIFSTINKMYYPRVKLNTNELMMKTFMENDNATNRISTKLYNVDDEKHWIEVSNLFDEKTNSLEKKAKKLNEKFVINYYK